MPAEMVGDMDRQADKMRKEQQLGIQLWIARGNRKHENLRGSIEAMPTPLGLFLNNIMVRPPFRRGLGSVMLHAALTVGITRREDAILSLNAYKGSSVCSNYRNLGLIETDSTMGVVHFETPPELGVKGVVRALEAKRPWLAGAIQSW